MTLFICDHENGTEDEEIKEKIVFCYPDVVSRKNRLECIHIELISSRFSKNSSSNVSSPPRHNGLCNRFKRCVGLSIMKMLSLYQQSSSYLAYLIFHLLEIKLKVMTVEGKQIRAGTISIIF